MSGSVQLERVNSISLDLTSLMLSFHISPVLSWACVSTYNLWYVR